MKKLILLLSFAFTFSQAKTYESPIESENEAYVFENNTDHKMLVAESDTRHLIDVKNFQISTIPSSSHIVEIIEPGECVRSTSLDKNKNYDIFMITQWEWDTGLWGTKITGGREHYLETVSLSESNYYNIIDFSAFLWFKSGTALLEYTKDLICDEI